MTAGRSSTRAVVIDAGSRELRRRLGPTSWMVLEEMLVGSVETAGECTVRVSVRGLALSLGIAKDTAAGAIRRLRDAELLRASQPRTVRGLFDAGSYVIDVPDSISFVVRPTRARVGRRDCAQLSFAIES